MGKWDDVLKNMLKLPSELRDGGNRYQDQVREEAAKIEQRKLADLARAWKVTRWQEEEHEIKAKAIRLKLRAIEMLMEEAFEAEGLRVVGFEEGGSVTYQPEPHTFVVDKDKFREWCLQQEGLPEQMALLWQTTNSIAKQHLESGKDLPPGLDCFSKPKFVLRD